MAWALLLCLLAVPSFGLIVFLAPLGMLLSAVAWRRAPHDGVFWIGLALNGLFLLGLVVVLAGVLTGDVGIGLD